MDLITADMTVVLDVSSIIEQYQQQAQVVSELLGAPEINIKDIIGHAIHGFYYPHSLVENIEQYLDDVREDLNLEETVQSNGMIGLTMIAYDVAVQCEVICKQIGMFHPDVPRMYSLLTFNRNEAVLHSEVTQ